MRLIPRFDFFRRRREYAALFVRLVVGLILVQQSQDNVFGHARMLEFRDFLALVMLFCSLFLLFNGAGEPSPDDLLERS